MVGRSGKSANRLALVTAIGRTSPARTALMIEVVVAKQRSEHGRRIRSVVAEDRRPL